MGYRHCGNEIYLDRYGRIRKLTGILRSRDRWRGLLGGLLKWESTCSRTTASTSTPSHIATAVKDEDAAIANHGERRDPAHFGRFAAGSEEVSCRDSAKNKVMP